jgi:hypothetical protein
MEAGNSSSGQATGSLSSASTSRHFVPVPPAAAVAELHRRAALLGSAAHKDYAWKLRHLQPMARLAPGVARRRLSGQRDEGEHGGLQSWILAAAVVCWVLPVTRSTGGSPARRRSRGAAPTAARRGPAEGAAAPSPSEGADPRLLLLRLLGVTETD